ncbi:glucose 1-dehydrogenase [Kineococcus sp. NBC_00420]|uniref:SDR family NAD(P)-dependent oxidoreductase n=1 Tax=unclassified Kineococcus TaxID=2621656 RepID=UPI002E1AEBFF
MTEKMLQDKVTLINGASRGIGAAAARLFAREGATLVLAARSDMTALVEELREHGATVSSVTADLGDVADVRRVVDVVLERHGRLDAAFNNAGMNVPPQGIAEFSEEDFDRVQRLNHKGVFFAVAAQVRAMRAGGGGAIVNTSSIGALHANPMLPAYGTAKRAVNSLTASAAVTYGPDGIRVNAIAPGLTLTDMVRDWEVASPGIIEAGTAAIPLGRIARPEEMAEAACWLLSDRASFVSGAVLPVTGGQGA